MGEMIRAHGDQQLSTPTGIIAVFDTLLPGFEGNARFLESLFF
jgi:hypothetical protein